MKLTHYALGIGGLAVGMTVAAGVAVAGTPSADGTFTACVATTNGATRIIDREAGQACGSGERAIAWTSGWRHRDQYDKTAAYQVGDVVTYDNWTCSYTTSRQRGIETAVKVAPGAETPQGSCPGANWRTIAHAPQRQPLPLWPTSFRVSTTHSGTTVYSTRGAPVKVWSYSDFVWVQVQGAGDVRKCTAVATPVGPATATVTRADLPYPEWIGFYTRVNGQPASFALDVTLDCPVS